MILSGVGKRYAVALFRAACNEGIAEQVDGDITSFARIFAENRRFRNYFMSPMVRVEDKRDVLLAVLGDRASGLFVKFADLLIDKKRMGDIEAIATAYRKLYEDQQGIVEVRAITAIKMDPDLQTRTRQVIEQKTGRSVRLFPVTDARIIGGMVLYINDRIVDGSIRHQLDAMRRALGELRVH